MPSWTDAYIGLPFIADGRTRAGCDCWGLVCIVYTEQMGIILPPYDGILGQQSAADLLRISRAIKVESRKWRPTITPGPFDVALFRKGGIPSHVGVLVDRRHMLHISDETAAVIENISAPLWKQRLAGFYRYAR